MNLLFIELGLLSGKEKKMQSRRHVTDHVQVSSTCNVAVAVPLSYSSGAFPPPFAAAISRAMPAGGENASASANYRRDSAVRLASFS